MWGNIGGIRRVLLYQCSCGLDVSTSGAEQPALLGNISFSCIGIGFRRKVSAYLRIYRALSKKYRRSGKNQRSMSRYRRTYKNISFSLNLSSVWKNKSAFREMPALPSRKSAFPEKFGLSPNIVVPSQDIRDYDEKSVFLPFYRAQKIGYRLFSKYRRFWQRNRLFPGKIGVFLKISSAKQKISAKRDISAVWTRISAFL